MNRREFIKMSAGCTGYAAFGLTLPEVLLSHAFAREEEAMMEIDDLLQAMDRNDIAEADRHLKKLFGEGRDAWEIHLLLFPSVQRVLNPPFINPHLPKMYAIYRELVPYLQKEEIPSLVHLEVTEYTRRSKLEKPGKSALLKQTVSFKDIESAIQEQDKEKTATVMATFHEQAGLEELARRLLLVGSGYLSDSLGHSISCTTFILKEMSVCKGENLWPGFTTLADYFCKGRFHHTPALNNSESLTSPDTVPRLLLQTATGGGIVNLHHTITLYAMERIRHLFNKTEYSHMMNALIAFMGKKGAKQPEIENPESAQQEDYSSFKQTFSGMDAKTATVFAKGMMTSSQGRRRLGRFLIRCLCEAYQGDYDPHYITGLGSALWAVDRYWNQDSAVMALYQYLDYLFDGLRPQRQ